MRFNESGSFTLPPGAVEWIARRQLMEGEGQEQISSPRELAAQLTRLVETDPDFELAAPATPTQVCFRAAPDSMDNTALNRLNVELQQRVNAGGELELGRYQLHDRYILRLEAEALALARRSAAHAWDVIGDTFVGLLIDSSDPRLRWRFGG